MPFMSKAPNTQFHHGTSAITGILLTNLGTPNAPTTSALRRYLGQFLSDPRVIELPRWFWYPLLHGVILNTRPAKSAAAYREVWTDDGSPLLVIARQQQQALQKALDTDDKVLSPVHVALGMRYGQPSIAQALDELAAHHCRQIIVLPLYPQYAAATVASTFDAVADALRTHRWLPDLRFISHYHDHPLYIHALAETVRQHFAQQGQPQKLLFSFHGVPKSTLLAGDPYHCQCRKTARLVAEALALEPDRWAVSFQSRFGREEWLQPYTIELLGEWGRQKLPSVAVMCPGFSADCLETIEEIGGENKEAFQHAGGGDFHYLPALNTHEAHISLLVSLIKHHGHGFSLFDPPSSPEDLAASKQRALELGAVR